jgi:hypothetical protein
MNVGIEEVRGYNCPNIPGDDETIDDHLEIDMLLPFVYSVSYYRRNPEDCPLARGNWMVDIRLKDGQMMCYKYPIEMKEEKFVTFLRPLLEKLVKGKK